MAARASGGVPPVFTYTVCTDHPSWLRRGTQKLVSRPPEKASARGPDRIMHDYADGGAATQTARSAAPRVLQRRRPPRPRVRRRALDRAPRHPIELVVVDPVDAGEVEPGGPARPHTSGRVPLGERLVRRQRRVGAQVKACRPELPKRAAEAIKLREG